MERHFQRQLDQLKKMMLSIGAMAEESVRLSIKAFQTKDNDLAEKVIESDRSIDQKEVELEEECLKVLALHQPVAIDLRIINAMIKINNDLERVGDEAVNIAERVISMNKQEKAEVIIDYMPMAAETEKMLETSLDALVNMDLDLAYKVCLADDTVDDMNRDICQRAEEAIKNEPDKVKYLINMLLVSRHLERIADHATNIAEEVIYMVEGVIHRHVSHK